MEPRAKPAGDEQRKIACFIVPFFAGLVVIARSLYPIPSRTRPSKSSAPMVLSLKAWKSRSSPGLPRTERFIPHHDQTNKSPAGNRGAFLFSHHARDARCAFTVSRHARACRGHPRLDSLAASAERWSHFLRQPAKVDSPMQRTDHHEDAETVFG